MKTNKEIVKEFIEAINDRDWLKALTLLHPDFVRHSSSEPTRIEKSIGLINFHKQELDIFPDLTETVDFAIEEAGLVAVRIHFLGTQLGFLGTFPPSGKVLDARFNCFFRVEGNLIRESWAEYDNLNGLIQLGHYP